MIMTLAQDFLLKVVPPLISNLMTVAVMCCKFNSTPVRHTMPINSLDTCLSQVVEVFIKVYR